MDAAGPDTVVSWKVTGYPGYRVADDRLDVSPDGGIRAADNTDRRRQHRDGPPRSIKEAVRGQPAAGLGEQLGYSPLTYGCDLLGDQLHLTTVVGPLEHSYHAHPLAVNGPTAPDMGGRHLDLDLGGPIPQREEHPPAAGGGRSVNLAFDGDATDPGEGAGQLSGQPDQGHPSRRPARRFVPEPHRARLSAGRSLVEEHIVIALKASDDQGRRRQPLGCHDVPGTRSVGRVAPRCMSRPIHRAPSAGRSTVKQQEQV